MIRPPGEAARKQHLFPGPEAEDLTPTGRFRQKPVQCHLIKLGVAIHIQENQQLPSVISLGLFAAHRPYDI
jgi:hypothetical protein